jgi:hypothetical protein
LINKDLSNSKIVCAGFDETCVMREYLEIGEDILNAVNVLKEAKRKSG